MPHAPPKRCPVWPCPELTDGGRCERHRREQRTEWERRANRGSSTAQGYGPAWRKIRAQVLAERPHCQHPGCPRMATEVHHVQPLRQGGSSEPSNLMSYCKTHHSRETNRARWAKVATENRVTSYRPPMDEGPRLH